ncbi:transposase [Leucobacter chromiiresistens]|uniref:Transposase n=1 Tax=Leucobacter chromiiresistens TaxID=1079994 RepID=A0A1H1A151_9MICO|nr:transposase [Leucobacter chromiiresistens]SDQ33454.1 hypothetical protein SAMN04488565_2251 [Leucobacter chromiiresistens]
MAFERKYSDEVRTAAVEEALRRRRAEPRNRSIIREVAEEYSVGYQSLRQWLARFDDGSYDFEGSEESTTGETEPSREELLAQIAVLQQRVDVLEADNRSLTRVVAMFADQVRPTTPA